MTKRTQRSVVEARWNKKDEVGRIVKEKFEDQIKPPVQAKNAVQREFLAALANYKVVVFVAPAGVGKSFITMSEASDWLKKGLIDKLVLSRAVIPMGRSLGMLPNNLQQKYEPFLMPLLEVMWNRYGKSYYENCLSNGTLELLAPEYSRGRSVKGCMVIDELQCMSKDELYTMITRMEEDSKLILIGDGTGLQTDIKGESGLDWLCKFVDNNPELQQYIKIIKATSDDIVRSNLTKSIVKAREKEVGIK